MRRAAPGRADQQQHGEQRGHGGEDQQREHPGTVQEPAHGAVIPGRVARVVGLHQAPVADEAAGAMQPDLGGDRGVRDDRARDREDRDTDTPALMEGQQPVFGVDVWEHAYYLKYQNRRADYLKAWWNVVDWTKIEARYAAAKAGKLAI